MSIYEYCSKCAYKRTYGCTRSTPTVDLIGLVKGEYRKRNKCKHFLSSNKRKKLR